MTRDDPFAHLRAKFAERCGADAGRLRTLDQDDPLMIETVHRLSGTAGTFGFADVSQAAETLENRLREGQPAPDELHRLLELLDAIQDD